MTELSSNVDSKLSDSIIERLHRQHIYNITQFIEQKPEKLATWTGYPFKEILSIRQNIIKKYGGVTINAFDLLQIEQNNILPTDLTSLDNLLNGGLYPGQIYEICGASSSGKTQLCLTIASNIVQKGNNIVRYIDTKRDFSGSRVEQMLLNKHYDKQVVDKVMNHIKVCCIYKLDQLFKILNLLAIHLKEEKEFCTKLIIIDSLPAVIFKSSRNHEATFALNRLTNLCRFIANEFHLSIIVVNLVTQWIYNEDEISANSSGSYNKVTPTLGKYWLHVPNTRLLIEKIGLEDRKISVWKSCQLEPNIACSVIINGCGVLCP